MRRAALVVAVLGMTAAAGCGNTVLTPVSGSISLDGKALDGATVTLVSDSGKMYSGMSDASGNFHVGAGGKQGVPSGAYKITVTRASAEEGPTGPAEVGSKDYMEMMRKAKEKKGSDAKSSAVPSLYANVGTTPLTCNVPDDVPLKLDVKSAAGPKAK